MNKSIPMIAVFLCILHSCIVSAGDAKRTEQNENCVSFSPLCEVIESVERNYVDTVDTGKMINTAIKSIVESLDPHSEYVSRRQLAELDAESTGTVCGVGIDVAMVGGRLTVISTVRGSSAFEQGMRAGDMIVAIDGVVTFGRGLFDTVMSLRGQEGSSVSVMVERPNTQELLTLPLRRTKLHHQAVHCRLLDGGIVLLQIVDFRKSTTGRIRHFLHQTEAQQKIKGVILDLRSNPGGGLANAVNVADIFMDHGVIVSTRGRKAEQNRVYRAHAGGGNLDFPMLVLVNGATASAAEALAGALQDNRRALVVGTLTFGKGTIQTLIPLSDGSAIRLTTGRYYTPSGKCVQAVGIIPDIDILIASHQKSNAPDDTTESIIRERDLPGHLENFGFSEQKKTAEIWAEKNNGEQDILLEDNQLAAAVHILRSFNVVGRRDN